MADVHRPDLDAHVIAACAQRGPLRRVLGTALEMRALPKPSFLVERLLELCAMGIISAVLVQWLCEGAILDGLKNDEVEDVAKKGASGTHAGNIRRDIYNKYGKNLDLPENARVRVPYVIYDAFGKFVIKYMDYPVVSPRLMLHCLADKYPSQFQRLLGAGPLAFWIQVKPDDSKLYGNPVVTMPNWTETYNPMI